MSWSFRFQGRVGAVAKAVRECTVQVTGELERTQVEHAKNTIGDQLKKIDQSRAILVEAGGAYWTKRPPASIDDFDAAKDAMLTIKIIPIFDLVE